MRPYKKRSFYAELKNKDCSLDNNEENTEKQKGNLSPNEENDKEKEGVPRGRKRWKRKISRKQFRHHDIKLFTPGEYKTSTLLKQKDVNNTEQNKLDNIQKETITDSIVTSLGGQKQHQVPVDVKISSHFRVADLIEPTACLKQKHEENNNTRSVQNNNSNNINVGKHHLPAIIMENPIVNRRMTDNNVPKNSCNGLDEYSFRKSFTESTPIQNHATPTVPLIQKPTYFEERQFMWQKIGLSSHLNKASPVVQTTQSQQINNYFKDTNNEAAKLCESIETTTIDEPEDLSVKQPVDLSKKKLEIQNKEVKYKDYEISKLDNLKIHLSRRKSKSNDERDNIQPRFQSHPSSPIQKSSISPSIVNISQSHKSESGSIQHNQSNDIGVRVLPVSLGHLSPPIHPHSPTYQQIDQVNRIISMLSGIRSYMTLPVPNELLKHVDSITTQLRMIIDDDNVPQNLKTEAQRLMSTLEDVVFRNKELNLVTPSMDLPNVASHDFGLEKERQYDAAYPYNPYPLQAYQKLPPHVQFSTPVDQLLNRPRSKSHRSEKKHHRHMIKRTMSNPQAGSRKEDITWDQSTLVSPIIERLQPAMYSPPAPIERTSPDYPDVFYQKLQQHISNGYTLPISVHPGMISRKGTGPTKHSLPNSNPLSPQAKKIHHSREEISIRMTENNNEKKSQVSNHMEPQRLSQSPEVIPITLPPLPKRPAVIVEDNSMEITKETTNKPLKNSPSITTILRTTGDRISSSPEIEFTNGKEKGQDENNTEFLVWMEKLKKDENLKSKFLTQMGILKRPIKQESTIEIMDSDEETHPQEPKTKPVQNDAHIPKCPTLPPLLPILAQGTTITPQVTSSIQPNANGIKYSLSSSIPNEAQCKQLGKKSNTLISESSKIQPIKLGFAPSPQRSPDKAIYSPQIEPISPVGNGSGFVFPDTIQSKADKAVTSPTYVQKFKSSNTYGQYKNPTSPRMASYPREAGTERRKSMDRPQAPGSPPRIAPHGKLCYIRDNHMFIRYFDDTQVELFISNLSLQDDELLKTTGLDPDQFKHSLPFSKRKHSSDQPLSGTEMIRLPEHVEFSRREDLREVEEFVNESNLVEQYVPRDFADFYRYVTGFQIIKKKAPVSLQTFLAMYNTNRTTELLRKYLQRTDVDTPMSGVR